MASIGNLVVDLALESANFINGLRAAQAQTTQTSQAMASAMNIAKGAFGGLAGVLSVDFIKDQTLAAFDYADAIVDLSDRTGAATKTIQEYRYGAQLSGSSVESADAALEKFAKNLGSVQNGNQGMAKSFKDLGVTSTDTDTALRQTMDGISKLGTISQRNAKSVELFGKSAADMTLYLSGGSAGFDQMAAAADSLGIVLEDNVLRNAGQVNDKLDTMKMVLTAQMAGAIVQNADALVQLANAFMTAAGAAAHFFQQMNVSKLMSVANGVSPFTSDIPTVIAGNLAGKSNDQISTDARNTLKTSGDGRQALLTNLSQRHNAKLKENGGRDTLELQAMRAEMRQIREKDYASNHIKLAPPPQIKGGTLPGPKATPKHEKKGPSAEDLAKKEAERVERYNQELFRATDGEIQAREALSTDVKERAGFERQLLSNATQRELDAIDSDVKVGKLKQDEADALKKLVGETSKSKLQLINNEEADKLAAESLSIKNAQNQNDSDLLNGEQALARTAKTRRDISLRLVDLEYQKEKLALEAITHSSTATQAEKDIADARLKILDTLKGQSVAKAKEGTMGPMEEYLSTIPKTADEINESLQKVQVEGLQGVRDDLLGVIRGTESVGEAFSNMVDTVLDGLIKIALEQTIIKPLGSLLFGGSDGSSGGGIFGSILKGIIGSVTGKSVAATNAASFSLDLGARANGGLTRPGDYLMGERGPEVVRIGATADVTSNHAINKLSGANDNNKAPTINFGNITSNDPAAIKAAAFQAIAEAMPMIRQQSSDFTIAKLGRPRLG